MRFMAMSYEIEDPQIKETTTQARQGERRKGMPTVLGVSTIAAAIALFGLFYMLVLWR